MLGKLMIVLGSRPGTTRTPAAPATAGLRLVPDPPSRSPEMAAVGTQGTHRPRPPTAMASVWRARKPARNLKRRDKAAFGHGLLLLVGLAVAAAGPALLAAAASFAI